MHVELRLITNQSSPQTAKIDDQYTIAQLLSLASDLFQDQSIANWHVIYCGNVLPDRAATLSHYRVEEGHPLFFLPSPTSFIADEAQIHRWLSQIVNLKYHFNPLQDQASGAAVSRAKIFELFYESINRSTTGNFWKPSHKDMQRLKRAITAIFTSKLSVNGIHFTWFEPYACALVAQCNDFDTVNLKLLCIDNWSFEMHSGPGKRMFSAKPDPRNLKTTVFRPILLAQYNPFLEKAKQLLSIAQRQTGTKRSAAGGQQGHQKTPAMIEAIIRAALNPENASNSPRGGFTDVGLHTGGLPRDTAWPLLYLHMAESAVSALISHESKYNSYNRSRFCTTIDSIIQTLAAAADEVIDLFDDRNFHDQARCLVLERESFLNRSILVRYLLEDANFCRGKEMGEKFRIWDLHKDEMKIRRPVLRLPQQMKLSAAETSVERMKATALSNLLIQYAPLKLDAGWIDLRGWLDRPRNNIGSLLNQISMCRMVEEFFFNRMIIKQLNEDENTVLMISLLVKEYRAIAISLRTRSDSKALLSSELLSRELLVVWIAFCIFHSSAKKNIGLVKEYSVPLIPEDLKHLVISEKSSLLALQMVAMYLKENSGKHNCIFSLRQADSTVTFARRYAKQSDYITTRWRQEQQAASQRVAKRYAIVQKKHETLRREDKELSTLEANLRTWKSIYDDTQPISRWSSTDNNRLRYEASDRIKSLDSGIVSKKIEIDNAETPPPPIYQPLPSIEVLSFPVMFFLWMPPCLRILIETSFEAQRMLFPPNRSEMIIGMTPGKSRKVSIDALTEDKPEMCWIGYYLHGSTARLHDAEPTTVVLGSTTPKPSRNDWYPSNVREHISDHVGVWHPDALNANIFWNGSKHATMQMPDDCYNPFSATDAMMAHNFLDPFKTSSVQWTLPQLGRDTSLMRGNQGHASLHSIPHWLDGRQYLYFTAARAYPYQQIRKLCSLLVDRSVPTDSYDVRMLLQHILYHVGDLIIEGDGIREWRHDLDWNEGWVSMRKALDGIEQEIRKKSRDHQVLLTCGILAAYCSQWEPPFSVIARRLASTARCWADKLGEENQSYSIQENAETRARRCLFYMYAILCYGWGDLTPNDTKELCYLMIMADYHRLFEDPCSFDNEISDISVMVYARLAQMQSQMLPIVDSNTSFLTVAVKHVLAMAPSHLKWTRVRLGKGPTTCFEAVSEDGHLYSVNLMTGTVLFDGTPPSRLPEMILQTDLYRRVFGRRNFEVVRDDSGVLTTTLPTDGRLYQFVFDEDKLLVTELEDSESGTLHLELLDRSTPTLTGWGADLPILLQMEQSHWLCRLQNVLLMRPNSFNKRDVDYICKKSTINMPSKQSWSCYRIPNHRKSEHWLSLTAVLEFFDELVLVDNNPAVKALSKIESPDLIHTFQQLNGNLSFLIARYGLEFGLSDSNTVLESNSLSGYVLSQDQQLQDTLMDFSQYLIMANGNMKIAIIPVGRVNRDENRVFIDGPQSNTARRAYHVYDIHKRFGTLEARIGKFAIEGRLQLATLYVATSSMAMERRSLRTGGEVAIELLRQSWSSKPFSEREYRHLETILAFDHHYSTLPLLCQELSKSSNELFALHGTGTAFSLDSFKVSDAATEYIQEKQKHRLTFRAVLRKDEEKNVIGSHVSHNANGRLYSDCFVSIVSDLMELQDVKHLQGALKAISVSYSERTSEKHIIEHVEAKSAVLSAEMLEELKESWDEYHRLEESTLNDSHSVVHGKVSVWLQKCQQVREHLENTLLQILSNIPCHCFDGINFCLRRSVSRESLPTARDLAKSACNPNILKSFNPFLTEKSKKHVHHGILEWMKLCVLEDKLHRLSKITQQENSIMLLRELREIERDWKAEKHPHWLLFEVEQGLQIRRLQHTVSRFCMDNKNTVTQLNMGEGKTRVILPMLIRELADPKHLVRIHILAPLLTEAYDFLHHTLTAGLFQQRICLLPFNRDVQMTYETVYQIYRVLQRCRETKGVLCLAPEHRLSLQLKWQELLLSGGEETKAVRDCLRDIYNIKYYDLFDESDELLHHKYQLIYSVGSCSLLPSGKARWVAAQAVLDQLQSNGKLRKIPAWKEVMSGTPKRIPYAGSFDDMRILPGQKLEETRRQIIRIIAEGILEEPPYHFRRLKDIEDQLAVVEFITDQSKDLKWLRQHIEKGGLLEHQKEILLALRGMLAFGLIEHCLIRRHHVDYGIDERRGHLRKVAVPYRASDTPTNRAEYAHPDILIVFTQLSYYHRGLSTSELKEALIVLLSLGSNAQRAEYDLWFRSATRAVESNALNTLDDVDKLDAKSDAQLAMLHSLYQFNMAAINFWLDACLFLRETMQFPHRITANAFNLADNTEGAIIGFSGTKDNRLLLPLQVKQKTPNLRVLRATDGKMLELLQKNDNVVTLGGDVPLNTQVLTLALENKVNALIDVGAAMAGLSNHQVAMKILTLLGKELYAHMRPTHKGVVYYNKQRSTWTVLALDGHSLPLGNSQIHERDAIVYFDESRCRGADMKLKDDAIALLTMGPFMCKDKLMQAAGRMRKLDLGQKLMFAVPQNLAAKIQSEGKPLTSSHLLNWVLRNSIKAVVDGLSEWGQQGSRFCTTRDPSTAVIDEVLDLETLYGNSITETTVAQNVLDGMKHNEDRLCRYKTEMSANMKTLHRNISRHVEKYGREWKIMALSLGEECEREIECERELEKEAEMEIMKCDPVKETKWNMEDVKAWDCVQTLPQEASVMHISKAMDSYFSPSGFNDICWQRADLFVTKNFIETVQTSEGHVLNDLSDFMRLVDVVIVFKDGQCLLVSEQEADQLLHRLWKMTKAELRSLNWLFANFTYIFGEDNYVRKVCELQLPMQVGLVSARDIGEHTLAGLQLFAGCTMFGSQDRTRALEDLLATENAKKAALRLVQYRRLQNTIARSDLAELCSRAGISCG